MFFTIFSYVFFKKSHYIMYNWFFFLLFVHNPHLFLEWFFGLTVFCIVPSFFPLCSHLHTPAVNLFNWIFHCFLLYSVSYITLCIALSAGALYVSPVFYQSHLPGAESALLTLGKEYWSAWCFLESDDHSGTCRVEFA